MKNSRFNLIPATVAALCERRPGGHRPPLQPALLLLLLIWSSITLPAQTTPVYFPLNSLFGGAAYGKTITITAANSLITDGNNLWAGTYQNVPWPGTNPVVQLYPNSYLVTVVGVTKSARFSVYAADGTNQVNVAARISSGPLFYFGGNGMANLVAGTNISLATNYDGSIAINSGSSVIGVTNGQQNVAFNYLNEVAGTFTANAIDGYVAYQLGLLNTIRNYATNEVSRLPYFSCATPIKDMSLVYQNYNGLIGQSAGPVNGLASYSTNMSALTIMAVVEYPLGVFHYATFAGNTNGVCQTNALLQSDLMPLFIPANTKFWVRTWVQAAKAPAGYIVSTVRNGPLDLFNATSLEGGSLIGTNDITFSTLTNTIPNAGSGAGQYYNFAPAAIVGSGMDHAIAFLGDSVSVSSAIQTGSSGNYQGFLAAAVGTNFPSVSMNWFGNALTYEATNPNPHLSLTLRACDIALSELGFNDGALDFTFSRMTNLLTQLWLSYATNGVKVYQTTITPRNSTTDGYTTLGNETDTMGAPRIAVNNWIRTCPPPLSGYFDAADAVESSRDSGKWKVNGLAYPNGICADGVHPTTNGAALLTAALTNWVAQLKPRLVGSGVVNNYVTNNITNTITSTITNTARFGFDYFTLNPTPSILGSSGTADNTKAFFVNYITMLGTATNNSGGAGNSSLYSIPTSMFWGKTNIYTRVTFLSTNNEVLAWNAHYYGCTTPYQGGGNFLDLALPVPVPGIYPTISTVASPTSPVVYQVTITNTYSSGFNPTNVMLNQFYLQMITNKATIWVYSIDVRTD